MGDKGWVEEADGGGGGGGGVEDDPKMDEGLLSRLYLKFPSGRWLR